MLRKIIKNPGLNEIRLGNRQYCTIRLFFEKSTLSQQGVLPRYTAFGRLLGKLDNRYAIT